MTINVIAIIRQNKHEKQKTITETEVGDHKYI